MKTRTVIGSAIIHAVVFGAALQISAQKARHRATSVAVVNDKKKPEKKPDKPKPKIVASAKPTPERTATPLHAAPTHVVETAPTAAPVDTGLQMGNDDGPGISLGGPALPAKTIAPKAAGGDAAAKAGASKVKQEKVLGGSKGPSPEEDNCTEAPSKPSPVQRSEIEYTQEARANNVEGRLVLRITVGADGSVEKVEVISSVDASLDAAAIAAVKTWTFKPAMRCGKPMGGVYTIAQRFELGD